MQSKPVLIIISGPNDARKITITEQLLTHLWLDNTTYINSDIIATENPAINAKRVALRLLKGGYIFMTILLMEKTPGYYLEQLKIKTSIRSNSTKTITLKLYLTILLILAPSTK